MTQDQTTLDVKFEFDSEVVNSRAYQGAMRSILKQIVYAEKKRQTPAVKFLLHTTDGSIIDAEVDLDTSDQEIIRQRFELEAEEGNISALSGSSTLRGFEDRVRYLDHDINVLPVPMKPSISTQSTVSSISKEAQPLSALSNSSTVSNSSDGLGEENRLTVQVVLNSPKCDILFRGKERNAYQNLLRHIKSMHSDTRLVCRNGDCNTAFTRPDNRSFHERTTCSHRCRY